MPLKKDKEKEYEKWKKEMKEEGLEPFVRLARWFFNLIDLGKMDIGSIIYTFRHTCELYEMFGISERNKSNIFFSIRAIVDYHDRGEEFRIYWNAAFLGMGYALEIEIMYQKENKRYLFNPYKK